MKGIRLFMWGYQSHFQMLAQSAAQQLLSEIDKTLDPKVFLVGILSHDLPDRFPICIEPEEVGISPELFDKVEEVAERLRKNDPEASLIHSQPLVQEQHDRRLQARSIKNAVLELIKPLDEERGLVSYCTRPALVEGYNVCVVLQLGRGCLDQHYELQTRQVGHKHEVPRSLLDALISEYLKGCEDALAKPDPGAGVSVLDREYGEIIRRAGNQLMYVPAWAGGNFYGLHWLFDSCNKISSLRYEGAEGKGTMLIGRRDHPNLDVTLTFARPVSIRDFRAVRKLLEISSEDVSMLSDAGYIYGLGKQIGAYNGRAENLFLVQFTKHYTWQLIHDCHLLMQVRYGEPRIPEPSLDESKFNSNVIRIFPDIREQHITDLWVVTTEATHQEHGTMLVVSSEAAAEADRLEHQSTRVAPIVLTQEMMRLVTGIDGAVLIDPQCTCYAIGVILDGLASPKGSFSRGARYNSAIRYEEAHRSNCLIIVVSEDGSIDLVPDLKPQIRRSEIAEVVSKLRKLKDAEQLDDKEYHKVMTWLQNNKFYLDRCVCDETNGLRREIEGRILLDDTIRVVYGDFEPDEEMDESYFLEE